MYTIRPTIQQANHKAMVMTFVFTVGKKARSTKEKLSDEKMTSSGHW